MRIGRDHIASTIYTIVFAYAGTALLTLLLVRLYDRPLWETIGTETLAEEVVRSLVSAIGLVLAVPITTAIASALIPHPEGGSLLRGRPHASPPHGSASVSEDGQILLPRAGLGLPGGARAATVA